MFLIAREVGRAEAMDWQLVDLGRWRCRSCDRNCSVAKIYADLKTAKEVQTEQTVHLGCWRKGMGEDGEVVDGFAEGFKPLHCNARTQFDPAPVVT